jgi:hypothetical protein
MIFGVPLLIAFAKEMLIFDISNHYVDLSDVLPGSLHSKNLFFAFTFIKRPVDRR